MIGIKEYGFVVVFKGIGYVINYWDLVGYIKCECVGFLF